MAGMEGPSRGGLLRGVSVPEKTSTEGISPQATPAIKAPPRPTASVSTVQEVLVLLNWLITALDNRRRKTLAGVLNKEYGPDEAEADRAIYRKVEEILESAGEVVDPSAHGTTRGTVAGEGPTGRAPAIPAAPSAPAPGPMKPFGSTNPAGQKVSFTKSGPIFKRG